MLFYERFEQVLKEKGVTIADVSRAAKIPYTTVDSIIKKKQKYTSMENNIKLAEYFGISMEWLATGKEISQDGKTLELSPLKRRVLDEVTSLNDETKFKMLEAFLCSMKKMDSGGD